MGEQLAAPKLAASFIVDRHHLPDMFLQRALAAKGIDRSILVTDAVAPAMCPPGPYMLCSVAVELQDDGRVTLLDSQRLAGSSLRMNRSIGTVMQPSNITIAQARTMATANP